MNVSNNIEIRAGGVACIRFLGLPDRQLAKLRLEFGTDICESSDTDTTPLVCVRFEPTSPPKDAVYVGRKDAVSGDMFYSGEGSHWASIPISHILDETVPFEVVADAGYDIIRLVGYVLEPLAKVRALLYGHCFMHSSAINYQGCAILLCAWGNTGKTNLLLHFSREGHQMLSDDWSLILADGTIAGYPRPVNLMNYNLDAFPHLVSGLSWKQRVIYKLDRCFRRVRPKVASWRPLLLRLTDGMERVLEVAANCRLPLGKFDSSIGAALPAAAIIEIHKLERGAEAIVNKCSLQDAAGMATVCFGFENNRIMQCLSEFAYVNPHHSNLSSQILDLYKKNLEVNLGKAAGETIYSVGMPARPTTEELAGVAQKIQTLCAQ